jgi:hypothetical protein
MKRKMIACTAASEFLRRRNYRCGDMEHFLYKMSLFENEDFDLLPGRTLYIGLLTLKAVGFGGKNVKEDDLIDEVYDICDFFNFADETSRLIYPIVEPGKEEHAMLTLDEALEEYLNKNRYYLDPWGGTGSEGYSELFDNKFALLVDGKFKHHLIGGEKKYGESVSLRLWSGDVFNEQKEFEFNFGNRGDMENFIRENKMVISQPLSKNYFLSEESYIATFRRKFDDNYLFKGDCSFDPFSRETER